MSQLEEWMRQSAAGRLVHDGLQHRPVHLREPPPSRTLRFCTLQNLYESFPTAVEDVGAPSSEEPAQSFLQSALLNDAWTAAISFCAYQLNRREAVWWGCLSLRKVRPDLNPAEARGLEAAEAWVREPEEEFRRVALRVGMGTDGRLPAAWMALAAGWSGGSIMPADFAHTPAGPQQSARAVRAGLLVALTQVASEDHGAVVRGWVASALHLMTGAPAER